MLAVAGPRLPLVFDSPTSMECTSTYSNMFPHTCGVSHNKLHITAPFSQGSILEPGTVLLDKLIVVQILKNFLPFYGTWSFVTVFTRTCHWSICWARWIKYISSHPISLISIIILSSYLYLDRPSDLFSSGFHCASLTCMLHAPAITSTFILSSQ
jgi:hypothetical protein